MRTVNFGSQTDVLFTLTALPPLKEAKPRPEIAKPFKQSSPGKEVWHSKM